jgi:hypothetical protein
LIPDELLPNRAGEIPNGGPPSLTAGSTAARATIHSANRSRSSALDSRVMRRTGFREAELARLSCLALWGAGTGMMDRRPTS